MKHPDQETLSQLMDGEWQGLDVRRCVVDACRDGTLRAKWSRYHLARDAMRGEPLAGATLSLAERIGAALEHEPTYSNVTAIGSTPGARAMARPATSPADTPADVPADAPTAALAAAPAESLAAADDIGRRTGARQVDGSGEEVSGRRVSGRGVVGPRNAGARIAGARTAPGTLPTVVTGFGLAASVALVTVLGLNAWQADSPEGTVEASAQVAVAVEAGGSEAGTPGARSSGVAPADPAANGAGVSLPATRVAGDTFSRQIPGAPLPEIELVANTGAYWAAPGSAVRRAGSERLNMFLSQHIENSPTAEREGLLPYSRLVGYDERAPGR